MSWGAQNRSKDAKTTSVGLAMSKKPEPGLWPVQPYLKMVRKILRSQGKFFGISDANQDSCW
jgi:hypothetical protein